MIQLNLLPDVKLQYIKTQKTQRLVTGISIIVTVVAVVILVLLLALDFGQKARISSLKSSVATKTSTLESKKDISSILTVQNQLEGLSSLYANRPAATNLFTTYLDEITPESISLTQLNADFTQHTLVLTGTADSLTTVNKYVDTLKYTTYSLKGSKVSTKAFSNVVLSSFGVNSQSSNAGQAASFTINLDFVPTIFSDTESVQLTVPSITTTRSETAVPGDLFKDTTSQTQSSAGGQ